MKKLLHSDNGVTSIFHYDEMEDKSTIQVTQDCESIVERNKALRNDPAPDGPLGRHVASIPLNVVHLWLQEDGVNFLALPKKEKGAYLRRKLNDPQWEKLRTSGGVF